MHAFKDVPSHGRLPKLPCSTLLSLGGRAARTAHPAQHTFSCFCCYCCSNVGTASSSASSLRACQQHWRHFEHRLQLAAARRPGSAAMQVHDVWWVPGQLLHQHLQVFLGVQEAQLRAGEGGG